MFIKIWIKIVLGHEQIRKTKCDQKLVEELFSVGKNLAKTESHNYDVVIGKTMCAHDFYEGKHPAKRVLLI